MVKLNATVEPPNLTISGLYWQSLDPTIAKVENDNLIALSQGETILQVRTVDGSVTKEVPITVSAVLGLDEFQVPTIYPNPIKDGHLLLHNINSDLQITVVSLTGKTMLKSPWLNQESYIVDVSVLQSGFYLLILHSNSFGRTTKKIIVEN